MFDEALKSRVNREVGRLNGELHDLHEQEESLKIRRSRLEVEMRQALAARDMFELLGRLDRQPAAVRLEPVMPEHPEGPQFVVTVTPPPDATPAAPSASKPQGLPSVPEMILQALVDAADGLRPRDITQTIRREWWADMPADRVPVTAFRMAKEGRLAKDGNKYRLLNGHG
jgi:hypothetical protein